MPVQCRATLNRAYGDDPVMRFAKMAKAPFRGKAFNIDVKMARMAAKGQRLGFLNWKLFALRRRYTYIGIRRFVSVGKAGYLGRRLQEEFDGVSERCEGFDWVCSQ